MGSGRRLRAEAGGECPVPGADVCLLVQPQALAAPRGPGCLPVSGQVFGGGAWAPRGQGISVCAGSTVLTRDRIAIGTASRKRRRAGWLPSAKPATGGLPGRGPVPPPGRGSGMAPGAEGRGPEKGGKGEAGEEAGRRHGADWASASVVSEAREEARDDHTPSRAFSSPCGDRGSLGLVRENTLVDPASKGRREMEETRLRLVGAQSHG